MKKRTILLCGPLILLMLLSVAFLTACGDADAGGKIIKRSAEDAKGFYTEYYLFIPDTLKPSDPGFLLVEMNNTGFVDDDHKTHQESAHETIRFGQANRIAKALGVPLLMPCFDRTETDWERYTHALDRDTLLCGEGPLARIDLQLLAMIADARGVLADKKLQIHDKILLNGFSASGSFANRFAALHPDQVAGVAAGGINGMAILPMANMNGKDLIYPVGIADVGEIAGISFQPEEFASIPQYYYMGADDDNDALPYDDAYSDTEREIVREVLDEDMGIRWECCRKIYESQGVHAEFHTYPGVGHETTDEINADIVSFFQRVITGF